MPDDGGGTDGTCNDSNSEDVPSTSDTNYIWDYVAAEFMLEEKYNLPTIHEEIDVPSDEHFEHGNAEAHASHAETYELRPDGSGELYGRLEDHIEKYSEKDRLPLSRSL